MRIALAAAIVSALMAGAAAPQDKVYLTNSEEGRRLAAMDSAVKSGDPERVLALGGTPAQALDAIYEMLAKKNPAIAPMIGRIRDVSDGARLDVGELRGKRVVRRHGVAGSTIAVSLDGQDVLSVGPDSEAHLILTGEPLR